MKNLILLALVLTGCSHKEVEEVKSPLNLLSGEHYNANPAGGVDQYIIPIPPSRKNKLTTVSGTLLTKQGLVHSPLNHKKLVLIHPKKGPVGETFSGGAGAFSFSGVFPNGSYQLRIEETQYDGALKFEVQSYQVEGLQLIVKQKP